MLWSIPLLLWLQGSRSSCWKVIIQRVSFQDRPHLYSHQSFCQPVSMETGHSRTERLDIKIYRFLSNYCSWPCLPEIPDLHGAVCCQRNNFTEHSARTVCGFEDYSIYPLRTRRCNTSWRHAGSRQNRRLQTFPGRHRLTRIWSQRRSLSFGSENRPSAHSQTTCKETNRNSLTVVFYAFLSLGESSCFLFWADYGDWDYLTETDSWAPVSRARTDQEQLSLFARDTVQTTDASSVSSSISLHLTNSVAFCEWMEKEKI